MGPNDTTAKSSSLLSYIKPPLSHPIWKMYTVRLRFQLQLNARTPRCKHFQKRAPLQCIGNIHVYSPRTLELVLRSPAASVGRTHHVGEKVASRWPSPPPPQPCSPSPRPHRSRAIYHRASIGSQAAVHSDRRGAGDSPSRGIADRWPRIGAAPPTRTTSRDGGAFSGGLPRDSKVPPLIYKDTCKLHTESPVLCPSGEMRHKYSIQVKVCKSR